MEDNKDKDLVAIHSKGWVKFNVKDVLTGIDLPKAFGEQLKDKDYNGLANEFTTEILDYLNEPYKYDSPNSIFIDQYEELLTEEQKEEVDADDIKDTFLRLLEDKDYISMLYDKGYLKLDTNADNIRMYGFNDTECEKNFISLVVEVRLDIDKDCIIGYKKFLEDAKQFLNERDTIQRDTDDMER